MGNIQKRPIVRNERVGYAGDLLRCSFPCEIVSPLFFFSHIFRAFVFYCKVHLINLPTWCSIFAYDP